MLGVAGHPAIAHCTARRRAFHPVPSLADFAHLARMMGLALDISLTTSPRATGPADRLPEPHMPLHSEPGSAASLHPTFNPCH